MFKIRYSFLTFLIFINFKVCFATPPNQGVQGNLIFLGVNHSSTKSVWLSLTSAAGSFRLEGPGRQIIDEWTKNRRGLELSLSPIVSNGNGGTHHLINAANNKKLDSENQRGGIVFPPFQPWTPGVYPSHPIILPGAPAHPIILPGAPAHPIILPGAPAHPIIYPGTPSHPIIYPGTPSHPIIYPGTPSHPIIYPGTPSHPIIYPGTPSHPIIYPGTPSHPIIYPGSPSHPIIYPGTPSHPIIYPGSPSHPIVIPPGSIPEGGRPIAEVPGQISSGYSQASLPETNIEGSFNQTAPITPARQVDEEKAWNIWSDNYYFGIRDGRNNVNTNGGATNFTIGADRHITKKLVGGLSVSAVHLNTTAFNGGLENNVRGYKVGPYFGYQISPTWSVDGSLNYGQYQNHNTILSLNSQYVTKSVNGTLHAIGLYQFGKFQLRPQPLITYTYFRNPTYDLNGTILNIPVQITRQSEHFDLGYAEFKVEANYTKVAKNGDVIQPYTEIGVDYAFVRPATDQVYSGNLALASIPKVSGLFTVGLRSIVSKNLLIQASGSYFSVGVKSYDLWDARLLISYSFS